MLPIQSGIVESVPCQARYLLFRIQEKSQIPMVLPLLRNLVDGRSAVLGLGPDVVDCFGDHRHLVPGLQHFQNFENAAVDIPGGNYDLWLWLRGDERGHIFHLSRTLVEALTPAFELIHCIDGFRYLPTDNDLSGFENSTENTRGETVEQTVAITEPLKGLYGSSLVAVQTWKHDFTWLDRHSVADKENCIGRSLEDNRELENVPQSAHVHRTKPESFDPPALTVQRSMPWVEGFQGGLMFVSFANTLDHFKRQLARMVGAEDNITDGLFAFSQPLDTAFFWCPPFRTGSLDFSRLGL